MSLDWLWSSDQQMLTYVSAALLCLVTVGLIAAACSSRMRRYVGSPLLLISAVGLVTTRMPGTASAALSAMSPRARLLSPQDGLTASLAPWAFVLFLLVAALMLLHLTERNWRNDARVPVWFSTVVILVALVGVAATVHEVHRQTPLGTTHQWGVSLVRDLASLSRS